MRRAALLSSVFAIAACSNPAPVRSNPTPNPPPAWSPGIAYATPRATDARGFLDLRGLIHAHSVHSWDACDDTPRTAPDGGAVADGGVTSPNEPCFDNFRDDLCNSQHDFVFLSEHASGDFPTTEYPGATLATPNPYFDEGDNTMLYTESLGDQLVLGSQGQPVANRVTCPDGHHALLIPGTEGENLMAVGLEQHVAATVDARSAVYTTSTDPSSFPGSTQAVESAIATERQNGAVVLVAHPEDLSEQELATFSLDGFEMYNLHENALLTDYGKAAVLGLIVALSTHDSQALPTNPNTVFLGIFWEDPQYLTRWAYALSSGKRLTTTLGSDVHQNAIPEIMSDGMRGDRYQRLMKWFSNHLLVTPNSDGTWTDANLKAAIKAGRLYGAFEAFGYPVGFDYHATAGASVVEMGGAASLASAPVLSVKLPTIQDLDPSKRAPTFKVRILLADGENWDEVASGPSDLTFKPTQPGAYRAEIREVPYHLTQDLGPVAAQYLSHDYVWIYSNAIYVTP